MQKKKIPYYALKERCNFSPKTNLYGWIYIHWKNECLKKRSAELRVAQQRIIQRHWRTASLLLLLLLLLLLFYWQWLINVYIVIKLRFVVAIGNCSIRAEGIGGISSNKNFDSLFLSKNLHNFYECLQYGSNKNY